MNLFKRGTAPDKTDELIEKHHDELQATGVTVIPQGYPEGLVDETFKGLKEFIAKNDNIFGKHIDADGHFPRIINIHLAYPKILKLFTENPVSLGVQDRFFGAKSAVYTSLYFERGSAQPIHRDTPYFSTKPEYNYLGVWVAMEDANEVNGCLNVIRGGHLIPEFDREKIALEHYPTLDDVPPNSQILWDTYQKLVLDACMARGLKIEQVPVKKGDVIIWHPQLPHGGSNIQDIKRSRNSLVMHVTPAGTPVYHQHVFFNPQKNVPVEAGWGYLDFEGRKFAQHQFVDFAHQDPHPPEAFVQ